MIEQPTTEETAPEAKSETRPLDLKEHSPLNVFTCGPKMRVTDPCYSRDTWCTAVFDVKPGEYQAHYLLKDMGEWGNRVAEHRRKRWCRFGPVRLLLRRQVPGQHWRVRRRRHTLWENV